MTSETRPADQLPEQGDGMGINQAGSRKLRVSLKQWHMLHTVVDCGGFAPASERLHLSQSAISHAIAKLQEQLGVILLKIEGRRAKLTEQGRALMERTRQLINEAAEIERYADSLGHGWEPEIRLAVDLAFPTDLLMQALAEFSGPGHATRVLLSEMAPSGVEEALLQEEADMAISREVPLGFLGQPLTNVDYIAVLGPKHRLLSLGREITVADLKRETQIVIQDPSPHDRNGTGHWLGQGQCWHVNSFDTATAAVREGLGYAWLPKHRIRDWLADGGLVPLPLRDGHSNAVTLHLIYGGSAPQGMAVSHLAKVLQHVSNNNDGGPPRGLPRGSEGLN